MNKPADVCLLLEGTYPFVTGGVSHWTHDLIQMHSDLTFSLVSILPTLGEFNPRYTLPPNVVSHQVIRLQILPYNTPKLPHKEAVQFFQQLEGKLLRIQQGGSYTDFEALLKLMDPLKKYLGEESLMRSQEAWKMIVRMYHATLGQACFLDYFWSWRGLMGAFFSILLAPIPEARVYHALCTGYAGLLLARARIELKRPCLITEHGIYTNERKIEIASAEWLHDQGDVDLGLDRSRFERTLKDLWIDIFSTYSRLAYSASEKIITLYKGNQPLQISDGADPKNFLSSRMELTSIGLKRLSESRSGL
jgi:Domain of unknown function (DUF3492).